MVKIVVQSSHLRIDDETMYRRGDVVDMSEDTIAKIGNAVKPLSAVSPAAVGVPEAMQKKDAEIRSLRATINDLELEIVSLKDKIAQADDMTDAPQKTSRRGKT